MDQQNQFKQPQPVQQSAAPTQDKRKQKSLFWIITTLYLTMILSGLVLGFIILFIGSLIFAGITGISASFISLILQLIAYMLALKIGVNYVAKKTFIKKQDVVKISIWVAVITVVLYAIGGLLFAGGLVTFDLVIIPIAALIFFVAKYFLEKKVTI